MVIDNRVDREMLVQRCLQCIVEQHILAQGERIRDHDLFKQRIGRRQQHLAHHHQTEQTVLPVDDVEIGYKRVAHLLTQGLGCFLHRQSRRAGPDDRLHQAGDGIVGLSLGSHVGRDRIALVQH